MKKKDTRVVKTKNKLRFARTRGGELIDQYGRIFTHAGEYTGRVGCATH